ncbi:hypothetical protein DFH06DRAFT_1164943 [Mycena polygramma]|nr:hypothetical protein DFH06DRAFT_1164943 [Mycena polygramma]
MNTDPGQAIDQLFTSFKQSRERVQHLEDTLALERRAAEDALAEAKANGVAVSLQLGAEIAGLRQEITVLQFTAATREQQLTDTSNDWRQRLSGALEAYNKTEAAKTQCAELERTVSALREENRLLGRKLETATAELATAAAQKAEEEESESYLRQKYDTLKTTHRELKRTLSEVNSTHAELVANATAHEQLALQYVEEKTDAERALQALRVKYDTLKARKSRKPVETNDEIEELTAEVNKLAGDVARAAKLKKTSDEAYKKLAKMYDEQKNFSRELQIEYDKLSATNKSVTKKYLALSKDSTTTSDVQDEYDNLELKYNQLKETCGDLEAQNRQLQQDCSNLRTRTTDLEKTCSDVIEAAESMDVESEQLRTTIASLRDDSRSSEERFTRVNTVNQALRSRLKHGRVPTAVARVLYEDFMAALPSSIAERPEFGLLQPVAKSGVNLHDIMASDPACASFLDQSTYLPKRTVWCTPARLHALAFHPTHRYHARGSWTEALEVPALHGAARELFVDVEDSIFYVGTYRAHDLRHLCLGGTPPPEVVSPLEMHFAAHLGTLPPDERVPVIAKAFANGILNADCMGFQCIGFNKALYDALRRRNGGTKREASPEVEVSEVKRVRR